VRLSALGLRRDPQGSVKQIHHEELEDGEKERPSAFPKIMLKQTDSGSKAAIRRKKCRALCRKSTNAGLDVGRSSTASSVILSVFCP
jgi:hypothetical protein